MEQHISLGSSKESTPFLEEYISQKLHETYRTDGHEYWFVVRPNVFAIPYLDGYLLYSPLQGLVALITNSGLASLLLNADSSISDCISGCIVEKDFSSIRLFDTSTVQQPNLKKRIASAFLPTHLTLSPTAACQLKCTYCYIRGGDKPRNMPWAIAEAAIRYTTKSAASHGIQRFDLEFHGQGEPTANWNLVENAVMLCEKLCRDSDMTPNISMVTNGMLSEKKVKFISEHSIRIGLSMDGLKDTMNKQRPLRSGGSSFDRIVKTIDLFTRHNVDFAVRSTVTAVNLQEMVDFVKYVDENTECTYINFEPVCGVGRANDYGMDGASIAPTFVDNYIAAKTEGAKRGISIGFSMSKTDGLRSSFCGAYGDGLNFCVSTEGNVSSCYEVLEETDPRSNIFIYGKYEPYLGEFIYFQDRLERLLSLDVTKMQRCDECYVRWNCGGDCISKASLNGIERLTDKSPLERCQVGRAIIRDELFRSLFLEQKESNV